MSCIIAATAATPTLSCFTRGAFCPGQCRSYTAAFTSTAVPYLGAHRQQHQQHQLLLHSRHPAALQCSPGRASILAACQSHHRASVACGLGLPLQTPQPPEVFECLYFKRWFARTRSGQVRKRKVGRFPHHRRSRFERVHSCRPPCPHLPHL